MRWTETLIPTLRQAPGEAEASSHRWLVRGGFIRQLGSGIYSYLPLGQRVLQKISAIIRSEMFRAGADEVLLPALHPAELWKKTGRYDALGGDKISFQSRSGQEYVLGPTHEEVITDLVAKSIKSYQDLPLTLFQIQTKFRDELRPRFGIIRTKEFIMKDAYSFDRDEPGLEESYQKMKKAYEKIFSRCGLKFQVVAADPGLMGGNVSQEFMVESRYGEDRVVRCDKCSSLTSLDIAGRGQVKAKSAPEPSGKKPEVFDTPNLKTIEEIATHFKIPREKMVKTLIYVGDDKPLAALVTGESELSEGKLRRLGGVKVLRMATAQEIEKFTEAPVGFTGPVGLKGIPLFVDYDVEGAGDFVTGANQKDKHLKNVNVGRDFNPTQVGDLRFVKEGDPCSECGSKLRIITTMEVGHIFKLGTRYSESLDAAFVDETGKRRHALMGCYGIGVTRVLAAIVEEHQDEKGIKWPRTAAPYLVHMITVNESDQTTRKTAKDLYEKAIKEGYEILYDDRNERAGVKFNDADLIGIPLQAILGEKNLSKGLIDFKNRSTGQSELVKIDEAVDYIRRFCSKTNDE
ncbi:MAG: proline--tRNA ligase [Candidatus Omnitrophica bacterium]|nr:proline--tRNA ligase [Candidatus Omnitrophota bacterium]